MGRVVQRLTPGKVQRTTKPGMYADGAGLYLRIGPNGAKSWIFRYTDGKTASGGQRLRDMGLGPLHTLGLAEARERARQQRLLRLDGANPIEARRHERDAARVAEAATTFRQIAERYITSHQAAWKSPKSLAAWEHTLGAFAYPVVGDLPVAAVDVGLVMKVLEPIWTSTPETATRLRGRIEAVLDYARVMGQRTGENPARWKGQLDHLLPGRQKVAKTIHHPALPYPEMADFIADLRQQGGTAARALEFAILTASRTGEVIGARWEEIDLEARLWVVPGERMKAGREHRVPLSDAAMAILAALPGDRSGRVFIHRKRPLSNMALLMLLRRMGRGDLTVHGFRSTFSDWCAEQTNTPSEVREMALAHAVGDRVEAAYRRGDLFEKRRQLADAWGRYCDGDRIEENVVKLRPAV